MLGRKPEKVVVAMQLLLNREMNDVARHIYMERIFENHLKYTGMDCIELVLPCGEKYIFNSKSFPSINMFCRCGSTKHIVVLWRIVTDGVPEGD